jgi:predicted nucleic-acid-binding Zn-ribbon protein
MASIYVCKDCGFKDEYINHIPSCKAPEKCPKCESLEFKQDSLETFKGVTFFDTPGSLAWQKKVDKINKAIADPSVNHNSSPY